MRLSCLLSQYLHLLAGLWWRELARVPAVLCLPQTVPNSLVCSNETQVGAQLFLFFCFVLLLFACLVLVFCAQLSRSTVRAPGSSLASSSVTCWSHCLWSLHLQPLPHNNDGFYLIRPLFRNLFNNHAQNWMQAPHARICSLPQLAGPPWMISAPTSCYSERCSRLVSALLSPSTFSFSLSPPRLSILILISLPLFVPVLVFSSIHSLSRHWASAVYWAVFWALGIHTQQFGWHHLLFSLVQRTQCPQEPIQASASQSSPGWLLQTMKPPEYNG